jgi:large subunit ribosomal protein L7/L12
MENRKWSPKVVEIGDRIATLTVAAAAELGTYLEVVHGVRAAPGLAVVQLTEADEIVWAPSSEPIEFDVVLDGYEAAHRVAVIRAVREATGLGLKEARDAVEACPRVVKERLPRPEADQLRARLEQAGATASIRPCAA